MKDTIQLPRSNPTGNKVRPVKRLSGTGIVTTGRGKEISVEYHLCFSQDDTGSQTEAPSKASMKEFSGQVWCPYDGSFVSVHLGKVMTLSIEDGRRLRFFHRNRDGAIAVTEWLG